MRVPDPPRIPHRMVPPRRARFHAHPLVIAGVWLMAAASCAWARPAMAQATRSQSSASVVTRYIEAVQKKDLRGIIELMSSYQGGVAQIKEANPRVLWPKLIDNYYDDKVKQLSQQPGYWQSYGETLGAMMGDPTQAIRASITLFPTTCKWTISEVRQQQAVNQGNGQPVRQETVYVTVNYPAWEDAPLVEAPGQSSAGLKMLMQTIIDFVVDESSDTVESVSRVAAGDAYGDKPLRIVNMEWGQLPNAFLSFSAVGGVPPFTCSIEVGAISSQKDCYRPSTSSFYVDLGQAVLSQPFPLSARVQISDSAGQTDQVFFTIPQPLRGLGGLALQRYCWGRAPWQNKGEGLPADSQNCLSPIRNLAQASAAGIASSQPMPSQAPLGVPVPQTRAQLSGVCGDFDSCMTAAMNEYRDADWPKAIADFQSATDQRPSSGGPWFWLGQLYFHNEQNAEASRAWDKALSLGTTIGIGVCHELAFRPCQSGNLYLSSASVSFAVNNSESVFSVPPSDVTFNGVFNNSRMGHVSFGLEVAHRRYNFDFFPLGVSCQVQLFVDCPQSGVAQQLAVANYVSEVIAKLASGALGAPPTAKQVPSATEQSTLASSSSSSSCATATNLGYAIQDGSHLYTVKGVGSVGPSQVHVFVDGTGAVVRDAGLLQQLTLSSWTKERIVDRYNPSSGSRQVRTFLAVSSNLAGWEDTTDALARATVESIRAVATGGTSLSTTAQNLTLGVVKNQLTNPKIALAHWARAGLDQSLADYTQMESLLPAAGTTTFKLSDLKKIESLYTQANTLALVNEALAAAIAPTTWQAEFANYLSSAVDELKPTVPASTTLHFSR